MTDWNGRWVAERLGVRTVTESGALELNDLVGLAVRRNPKRAHLLVSTVLGKHIPTDPLIVLGAGRLLGALVADLLAGVDTDVAAVGGQLLGAALAGDRDTARTLLDLCVRTDVASAVVLGYAETATGLGHAVADVLGAPYLHSTRRSVATAAAIGGFEEEHSHATSHQLLPEDADFLGRGGTIVLVDDELSTGQTVINTIAALHDADATRTRFVVAALVDTRSAPDRARIEAFAAGRGISVAVTALVAGRVEQPEDILARGNALVTKHRPTEVSIRPATAGLSDPILDSWPVGVREGGRHGFDPQDRAPLEAAAAAEARRLARGIAPGGRVLVLGSEELMYAPLRIAVALAERHPDAEVRYSTTTRSPVLAIDEPGYAIRTRLLFPAHDDRGGGERYAYNVSDGGFTDIVLVVDDETDHRRLNGPDGLVTQLRAVAAHVQVVVVPAYRPDRPQPLHGPEFGSYARDEVSWLLTDLSAVTLEAPTEDREEAIQSGQAHYAESLPIEYQPSAEYQELYAQALAQSAERVAVAVGVVTELVLQERGPDAVLVSLARAGTPIGILMRRWALRARGLTLPHYAMSIVRGRGLDLAALRFLAAQHDSTEIMFVDGWTGKGAITRELIDAVNHANGVLGSRFRPGMAVLADPGGCVSLWGTREDFLIPSACLNSTVSGLVSRTVLNPRLLRPDQFHGAKFYAELGDVDVSGAFLDAVTSHFAAVSAEVAAQVEQAVSSERVPTWVSWRAVEEVAARYGIDDLNLVKPGVGETTRVLLRRVPWRILIRSDRVAALGHVLLLAEQRGVPVELDDELAYSCVGLIHPQFNRSAARPAPAGLAS